MDRRRTSVWAHRFVATSVDRCSICTTRHFTTSVENHYWHSRRLQNIRCIGKYAIWGRAIVQRRPVSLLKDGFWLPLASRENGTALTWFALAVKSWGSTLRYELHLLLKRTNVNQGPGSHFLFFLIIPLYPAPNPPTLQIQVHLLVRFIVHDSCIFFGLTS